MLKIKIFLYLIFLIIILLQSFYLCNSLFLIFLKNRKEKFNNKNNKSKISIIIPLFNSEATIGKCLDSIIKSNFSLISKIVIVDDHSEDESIMVVNSRREEFLSRNINFKIISLLKEKKGKVQAIKEGIKHIHTKNVLLLDADIILKNNTIKELLDFHINKNNVYSSCFIYPYQKNENLISQIINNDRIYRQNILKNVKNFYEVANFPGSLGIVNINRYKKNLSSGFIEDLTATYCIINSGEKISILPKVLAYEIDRYSFIGVFLQRIRWTLGNIQNIPLLIKTITKSSKLLIKVLIFSYPVMWYLQHYVIVLGILIFLFVKFDYFWLLPFLMYFLQILVSSFYSRRAYRNSLKGVLLHSLFFPFIITLSLIGSVIFLLVEKNFYFRTNILFKRI
jgi:glycosyltransferase involved in cell wall biosynthesis